MIVNLVRAALWLGHDKKSPMHIISTFPSTQHMILEVSSPVCHCLAGCWRGWGSLPLALFFIRLPVSILGSPVALGSDQTCSGSYWSNHSLLSGWEEFAALTFMRISHLPQGKCPWQMQNSPGALCWAGDTKLCLLLTLASDTHAACGGKIYFYLRWWSINHMPGL